MKKLIICIAVLMSPSMTSGQETDTITGSLVDQMTIRFGNDGTVSVTCDGLQEDAEANVLVWIGVVSLGISVADFAIRHGPGLIDAIQRLMDEAPDDHLILLDHETAMLRGLFNQCIALTDVALAQ